MTEFTLCYIVKDEEAMLRKLLPIMRPSVKQVVVMDTGSTDGTVAYCKSLDCIVKQTTWTRDYSEAYNAALAVAEAAGAKWILQLDGDECMFPEDLLLLKHLLSYDPRPRGFPRLTLWGDNGSHWFPHYYPDGQWRLFPTRKGWKWVGKAHTTPALNGLGMHHRGMPFGPMPIFHYSGCREPNDWWRRVLAHQQIFADAPDQYLVPTPSNLAAQNVGVEPCQFIHPLKPHFEGASKTSNLT